MDKRKKHGVADLPRGGVYLFHLNPGQFPGLSCEPGKEGLLRLDQNDGEPVPLAQIPEAAIRDASLTVLADGAAVAWLGQPIVLTEFLGGTRHRLKSDLSKFIKARLIVNVVFSGFDGAELRVQYSTDQSSWFYLDGLASPGVGIC